MRNSKSTSWNSSVSKRITSAKPTDTFTCLPSVAALSDDAAMSQHSTEASQHLQVAPLRPPLQEIRLAFAGTGDALDAALTRLIARGATPTMRVALARARKAREKASKVKAKERAKERKEKVKGQARARRVAEVDRARPTAEHVQGKGRQREEDRHRKARKGCASWTIRGSAPRATQNAHSFATPLANSTKLGNAGMEQNASFHIIVRRVVYSWCSRSLPRN